MTVLTCFEKFKNNKVNLNIENKSAITLDILKRFDVAIVGGGGVGLVYND